MPGTPEPRICVRYLVVIGDAIVDREAEPRLRRNANQNEDKSDA